VEGGWVADNRVERLELVRKLNILLMALSSILILQNLLVLASQDVGLDEQRERVLLIIAASISLGMSFQIAFDERCYKKLKQFRNTIKAIQEECGRQDDHR